MAQIDGQIVRLDASFGVSFQRTLRIPDDGQHYPLPPGLGALPVFRVDEYAHRLPAAWRERGGVFVPLYQREALWLGLHSSPERPHALQVAAGGCNVLTGEPHGRGLRREPQNYMVCPPQVWLDGVRTERGSVRQFVAVPLGQGKSLEASLTGVELRGGLQLTAFAARAGLVFHPPTARVPAPQRALAMGLGLGGAIVQKIYPDPHGPETWDESSASSLVVHLLDSREFRRITGCEPPPTPIDVQTYAQRGLPWFRLYDEELGDLPADVALQGAATLAEHDTRAGQSEPGAEPGATRFTPRRPGAA